MKRFGVVALSLGLLAVVSTGCAELSPFRVSGYIESAAGKPLPDAQKLYAALDDAVRPFGLTGGWNMGVEPFGFYFEIFSPERVDISVVPNTGFITLKDYNNFEETKFSRSVLSAIKEHLMSLYGAKINFRRVADFFG